MLIPCLRSSSDLYLVRHLYGGRLGSAVERSSSCRSLKRGRLGTCVSMAPWASQEKPSSAQTLSPLRVLVPGFTLKPSEEPLRPQEILHLAGRENATLPTPGLADPSTALASVDGAGTLTEANSLTHLLPLFALSREGEERELCGSSLL